MVPHSHLGSNMIENTTAGGLKQRWDTEQYMKYRRARGFDCHKPSVHIDHPFLGKKFLNTADDQPQVVTIRQVTKQWWGGYYLAAVYMNENGSHGLVFFENINCVTDYILEAIESFTQDFKEIENE